MGIAKGALKILLKEAMRRPFGGRALILSCQDVYFDEDLLRRTASEFGVSLVIRDRLMLSAKEDFQQKGFISDVALLKSLGFTDVRRMDVCPYEGADLIHDLNSTDLDPLWLDSFDFILDAGTSEHVFHLPNLLCNLHRMLRTGGRIIHILPSSNHVDHGFYMFSPTLFWDYYEQNHYEICSFLLIRHTQKHDTEPWQISEYTPGCLDRVSFGGLDDGMYAFACVVSKTSLSIGGSVPQQGAYRRIWMSSNLRSVPDPGQTASLAPRRSPSGLLGRISYGLSWRRDLMKEYVRGLISRACPHRKSSLQITPKKGLGLPVVGEY